MNSDSLKKHKEHFLEETVTLESDSLNTYEVKFPLDIVINNLNKRSKLVIAYIITANSQVLATKLISLAFYGDSLDFLLPQ